MLLKNIAGDGGRIKIAKLLHPIIHHIICPDTLKLYSWTGKGNKITFSSLRQINDLIYRLLKVADQTYTFVNYKADIVKKVLKYTNTKGTQMMKKPQVLIEVAVNAERGGAVYEDDGDVYQEIILDNHYPTDYDDMVEYIEYDSSAEHAVT